MNAQNDKNRSAIFIILCHLRREQRGANGYIEYQKCEAARSAASHYLGFMS